MPLIEDEGAMMKRRVGKSWIRCSIGVDVFWVMKG